MRVGLGELTAKTPHILGGGLRKISKNQSLALIEQLFRLCELGIFLNFCFHGENKTAFFQRNQRAPSPRPDTDVPRVGLNDSPTVIGISYSILECARRVKWWLD